MILNQCRTSERKVGILIPFKLLSNSTPRPETRITPTSDFRGSGETTKARWDIQGLRAIAVLTVVIYHIWPQYLPGGYIGVDVFLVVSGFLITQHLVKELESNGRIRLFHFWARRIRRLLPAALLVILTTLLITVFVLPKVHWPTTATESIASVFYLQN